ncbi:MAG: DUF305 domain-containing protein [Aquabacterium sp.]
MTSPWAVCVAAGLWLCGCQPAEPVARTSAGPAASHSTASEAAEASAVPGASSFGAATASTTPVPAPAPGPVSIGFAQDMSLHHEQALTMARMALANGTPLVQTLAHGIVNQQLREIGHMQGWLMLWDAPAASNADDMPWMKQAYHAAKRRDEAYERFIDRCTQGQGMPGAATAEDLEALSRMKERRFDARFLELMIRHHQGAMVMARFASDFAEHPVVRQFGAVIASSQAQELMWMTRQLAQLSRAPVSAKPG